MEHTPINELPNAQRGAKIRCRVLRMWDSTNPLQQDQLMSLELLLADEQGHCIQATIRKEDAPRIRELFQEGKIYTIANFVMSPARRKFRVAQNENLLRIGTWTIVREVADPHLQIPFHSFTFLDDQELDSRLYNDIYLTNFIAYLISIGKLRDAYANGRMVPVRSLELETNRMRKITATLWGAIAEGITEEDVEKQPKNIPVIAILSSMTLRAYKAETTLSSTSGTRVYLNLQIPEVANYRIELPVPDKITKLLASPVESPGFMSSTVPLRKGIAELLALNRVTDLGTQYSCEATITEIDASEGWYYNACTKCKAGVSTYKGTMSCSKCGPITTLPIPWYKVTVIVTDGQGCARFLMFGNHIEKLIQISEANLSEIPNSNRNEMPPVMEQLRGTRCSFIVTINDRDLNTTELTFTVSQVIPVATPLNICGPNKTISAETKILTQMNEASKQLTTQDKANEALPEENKAIKRDSQVNKRPRKTNAAANEATIVDITTESPEKELDKE